MKALAENNVAKKIFTAAKDLRSLFEKLYEAEFFYTHTQLTIRKKIICRATVAGLKKLTKNSVASEAFSILL